jgi:cytochrome c biogenesis protein CcdA
MALFVLGFITAFIVVIAVVFGLFMAYDADKEVVNYIILAMAIILGLVAGYATSRKTT